VTATHGRLTLSYHPSCYPWIPFHTGFITIIRNPKSTREKRSLFTPIEIIVGY